MDPTQRRIAWTMLLAIVVYFAVQFSRTQEEIPSSAAVSLQATETPSQGVCSLKVSQVFYNADLGFVEAQVTGSAEQMVAIWAGGRKEAPTNEVCSAGICRMVVGVDRRDLAVQFDGCGPIQLPNP